MWYNQYINNTKKVWVKQKKRQGINEERRKSLPVIHAQTIKLEDHRDPTLLDLFAFFTKPKKLKEEYLHRLGKTRIYTSNTESGWLEQCMNIIIESNIEATMKINKR